MKNGDGAAPENFTTIAQVEECDFNDSKWTVNKVTSADNVDKSERKAPTLLDEGTCTVSILWNPNDATHQQLWNAYRAGAEKNFKVVNPGGLGTKSFPGIIVSLDPGKKTLDKPTKYTCKIDLSGPLVESIPGA